MTRFNSRYVSLLGALVLCFAISCSKKDVVSNDPAITPSGDGSGMETGSGAMGSASGDFATVYFEYDSFSLSSDARTNLKASAEFLKKNKSAAVQVEGHCDERGTTEYNMALGEKRANAVKSYLLKLGVSSKRVSMVSYGEERPSSDGHDESAWSQNRRAVFINTAQ